MRRTVVLVLAFAVCATAHAQVDWILWDPTTIRSDRTTPVRLELQAASNVAAVRIDFAATGSQTLTPMGSGRFTANVAAAPLLFDYKADDVHRNFVGFIRLLDASSAVIASFNAFVNVIDANIPAVQVTTRDSGARQTRRILNLHRPLIGANDVRNAILQFYSYFPDQFDFVQVVFTLPNYPANRYHFGVRNDVSGIGLNLYNNTSQYGSAGRLLGVNVYPIDYFFDAAETAFSHETGHQWINFLKHPKMLPGPHWPPSTMATGVMGFNIPGSNVGGEFNFAIEQVSAGTYRTTNSAATKEFSDFDLYVMGLLPASQVAPGIVLDGAACHNCTISGSQFTVQDLINSGGPRLPSSTDSQKSFRVGTVVISRDRLLTDDEMAVLEFFAARGEARTTLPFSAGLAKGTTKPFYLATRGLATVDLRLTQSTKRRNVRR